mgnify:CR=1 FL=1
MAKSIEKRVEELEKIVKKLQMEKSAKLRKDLSVGDTFELVGLKWKILEITEKGYKCIAEEESIDTNELNVFNLDAEKEIEEAIKTSDTGKINLYKMNFEKGVKALAFANCVYYDNQNKTLPEGMDLSTSVLLDCNRFSFELLGKSKFRTNNYFLESNNLVYCDIYSIKFVTIATSRWYGNMNNHKRWK